MTPRQRDLYSFIARHQREFGGVSPSYAEMAAAIGLKSKSGVFRMLSALKAQGRVRWHPRASRSVELLGEGAPGAERRFLQAADALGKVLTSGRGDRLEAERAFRAAWREWSDGIEARAAGAAQSDVEDFARKRRRAA